MLKLYCVTSCSSCLCYVYPEASMVLHGCAQIETSFQSSVPGASVVRLDMGLDAAAEWGKWFLHVVVGSVDVGKSQDLGRDL